MRGLWASGDCDRFCILDSKPGTQRKQYLPSGEVKFVSVLMDLAFPSAGDYYVTRCVNKASQARITQLARTISYSRLSTATTPISLSTTNSVPFRGIEPPPSSRQNRRIRGQLSLSEDQKERRMRGHWSTKLPKQRISFVQLASCQPPCSASWTAELRLKKP